MKTIIIFSILAYLIIGFFLAGVVSGYTDEDFCKNPIYVLIAMIWPIIFVALSMLGFVYLGSKLGKKIKK